MLNLIVEKLFGNTNLVLEVGQANFQIKDGVMMVEVIFQKASSANKPEAKQLLENTEDFFFKESEAKLELELPIPKTVKNVIGKEFFIDSQDEDNEDLTNFYIADTHYPTFDDTIVVSQTDNDTYLLKWAGFVPDIKSNRYEIYMQLRYKFLLETPIVFVK